MMVTNQELVYSLVIAVVFALIFLIAEGLRRYKNIEVEKTRKFIHISAALVSLSFAYLFHSQWIVLIFCLAFVGLLSFTKHINILRSIYGFDRETSGSVYYPLAIYVTFLLATMLKEPNFYFISILVLTVSDSLAALIGKSYGFKLYRVQNEKKSIEGSLVFFFSTFLIMVLSLLLLTNFGKLECVLISMLIAILVTAFEAISLDGADNLFVPIGTLFILTKTTAKSLDELILQIVIVSAIFFIVFIVSYPAKKLGESGIIGLALLCYAAQSMAGTAWLIPIILGTIVISYTDLFIEIPKSKDELHRIRPVFYILIIPFIWILFANFSVQTLTPRAYYIFFFPFLISILGQLSILWCWKSKLDIFSDTESKFALFKKAGSLVRATILTVIFGGFSFYFYPDLNILYSIVTCIIGILVSDILYWKVANKFLTKWRQIEFLRVGLAVSLFVSLLIFDLNLFYYIIL